MPTDFRVVYAIAGTNGARIVRQVEGSSPTAMAALAGAGVGQELVLDIRATVRPGRMRRQGAAFAPPPAMPPEETPPSPSAAEPSRVQLLLQDQRALLERIETLVERALEPRPQMFLPVDHNRIAQLGYRPEPGSAPEHVLRRLSEGPIARMTLWAVESEARTGLTRHAFQVAARDLLRRRLVRRPRRGCYELTTSGRRLVAALFTTPGAAPGNAEGERRC